MLPVLICTLGCKLNQLESEALADAFIKAGFVLHTPAVKTSPAVIVINTCTVTSKADQKARRVIRKALRDNPDSLVLVTGCYAQMDKAQIEELETGGIRERLFVFKGREKGDLLDLPRYLCESACASVCENKTELREAVKIWCKNGGEQIQDRNSAFHFSPDHFSGHTRGFLKIQDGCDRHCTYCRVRLARGPSISLNADQVLARLRVLEENHGEAVLTGVNITQYREAGSRAANSLGGLLEYLLAGTSKINLRLSSLAPDCVDENLAKILSNRRIRPHFHLSIQSGSEKILEKMGRTYSPETIEKAVALLRSAKGDPFLACDIITGFPGETDEEFEKTYELCRKIRFAWIHVFPYSKRPGTPAWSFPDSVHEEEVTRRVQMFFSLAEQGRRDYVRRWLGRDLEVLVEKEKTAKKGFCRGTSENYLKLLVQYREKAPLPGDILHCRLPVNQQIQDIDGDCDAIAISV